MLEKYQERSLPILFKNIKYSIMKYYLVYRNKKGQLTFKFSAEVVYSFWANSQQFADKQLKRYKQLEKNPDQDGI